MTLREAINEVIRLCWEAGDSEPPTPNQALMFLNDTLLHASFITRYFVQTSTVPVAANQKLVNAPAVHILRAFWNNTPLKRFGTLWATAPDASATTPTHYWDNQDRILLFPTPTTAGTLKLIAQGEHPTFTIADIDNPTKTIEFPARLHRFLCLHAAGSYLLAFPASIQRAQLYQQEANAMFLEYRRQWEENQRTPLQNIADGITAWTFDLVAPYRPQIGDDAIQRAVDDAIIAFFGKHQKLMDIVTVSVPAGARYVTLNDQSVLRITRVYREVSPERWVALTSWDGYYDLLAHRDRQGTPETYVAYGNRIELYPRPNEATTLRIEGAIVPTANPLQYIPAHLHRSLATYAAGLLTESIITEKGASVGLVYQQKALAEWTQWIRDVNEQVIHQDDYALNLIHQPWFDTYRLWRD